MAPSSSNAQQTANAQQSAPATVSRSERLGRSEADHGLDELSLEETLRVMDVAREMREARQTAEEMFRRDDLRSNLRKKLLRQARMSGDAVTESEIDAAIGQYLATRHVYEDPPAGLKSIFAHAWVYRARIAIASVASVVAAGGLFYLFS